MLRKHAFGILVSALLSYDSSYEHPRTASDGSLAVPKLIGVPKSSTCQVKVLRRVLRVSKEKKSYTIYGHCMHKV